METERIYRNKDWLMNQYWNKYLSTYKLARKANCCSQTIRLWMIKYNIPLRTEWKQFSEYETKLRFSWRTYKRGCKRVGRQFTFSLEDFEKIVTQPCHYCGKEADPINGIDRLDNEQEYVLDNCVPCCKECNMLKRSMNVIDFIYQVYKIQKYCSEKYSIEHTYRRDK